MVTRVVGNAGSSSNALCACGEVHGIPTALVVIEERAIEQLVGYVKERAWSRPFVVMDANTEEAAGGQVIGELSRAGTHVTSVLLSRAQRPAGQRDERHAPA